MDKLHKHYGLHQIALLPVLHDEFIHHWQINSEFDFAQFSSFLNQQRMHGLWAQALQGQAIPAELSYLKMQLLEMCKVSAAMELPQQRSMAEAHDLLTARSIPYFFAKGAQLRQVIYQHPWHRPAIDVDLFIHERDQPQARAAFQECGYSNSPCPKTATHEMSFSKHGASIDLHWHLMRPSRYRPGLDNWLFEHRETFDTYWGLDSTASLLVMLTHPPITKYLISPTSMLIHQVDQLRLMEKVQVDWGGLHQALHDSGLKTAAWSSIYLLQLLTGKEVKPDFEKAIRPGNLKRRYIQAWVENAWISRQFDKRWLVAAGFNLALQDSMLDTARAAIKTLGHRRTL
jgi:hypothetical protein